MVNKVNFMPQNRQPTCEIYLYRAGFLAEVFDFNPACAAMGSDNYEVTDSGKDTIQLEIVGFKLVALRTIGAMKHYCNAIPSKKVSQYLALQFAFGVFH